MDISMKNKNIKDLFYLVVFFLLCFSIPLCFLGKYGQQGEFTFILMTSFCVIAFFAEKKTDDNLKPNYSPLVFLCFNVFILSLIFSSCFSPQPAESIYAASYWVILSFFVYYSSNVIVDQPYLKKFIPSMIVAGLILYLILLFYLFYHIDFKLTAFTFPVLNYVRAFGIIMGAGALIAFLKGVETQSSYTRRLIFFAISTIFFSAVFWSGTRTAIFAGFCTLVTIVLIRKTLFDVRNLFSLTLCLFLAILISFAVDLDLPFLGIKRIIYQTSSEGLAVESVGSGRFPVWFEYLDHLKNYFWAGIGEYSHHLILDEPKIFRDHPENFFLFFLTNWGIFGAISMTVLVLWVVNLSVRATKEAKEFSAIPVTVYFYLLYASAIEAGFYRFTDRTWFALFAAIVIASNIRSPSSLKIKSYVKVFYIILFTSSILLRFIGIYEKNVAFSQDPKTLYQAKLVELYPVHLSKWVRHSHFVKYNLALFNEFPDEKRGMLQHLSEICSTKSCRDFSRAMLAVQDGDLEFVERYLDDFSEDSPPDELFYKNRLCVIINEKNIVH